MRTPAQLLLLCAGPTRQAAADDTLRAELTARPPGNDAEWDALFALAAAHGMIPLLCTALLRTCNHLLPPHIQARARHYLHNNALRNLGITRSMLSAMQALQNAGVAALPYKGPALATLAYGSIGLRGFSDVDLLVAQADVPRAIKALHEAGYRADTAMPDNQMSAFLRYQHELRMVHTADHVLLELHWKPTARFFHFPFDLNRALSRAVQVQVGNTGQVRTLCAQDYLPLLCVHGSKHLWERMIWVCDVAQLLHNCADTVDWDQMDFEVRAMGVRRMLHLGLLLAHNLLQAPLPDPVLAAAMADQHALYAAWQTQDWLTGNQALPDLNYMNMMFLRYDLRARERWRDKLRYLLYRPTTPSADDIAAMNLPARLSWLCPALRPPRLVLKYSRRIFKRSNR